MNLTRFALTGLAAAVIALAIGHVATLPAVMLAACHDDSLRR
jgi:hypothetical protein